MKLAKAHKSLPASKLTNLHIGKYVFTHCGNVVKLVRLSCWYSISSSFSPWLFRPGEIAQLSQYQLFKWPAFLRCTHSILVHVTPDNALGLFPRLSGLCTRCTFIHDTSYIKCALQAMQQWFAVRGVRHEITPRTKEGSGVKPCVLASRPSRQKFCCFC